MGSEVWGVSNVDVVPETSLNSTKAGRGKLRLQVCFYVDSSITDGVKFSLAHFNITSSITWKWEIVTPYVPSHCSCPRHKKQ